MAGGGLGELGGKEQEAPPAAPPAAPPPAPPPFAPMPVPTSSSEDVFDEAEAEDAFEPGFGAAEPEGFVPTEDFVFEPEEEFEPEAVPQPAGFEAADDEAARVAELQEKTRNLLEALDDLD